MKYSSYINIPNLSYQVSSINCSNHHNPISITNIKGCLSPYSNFENKKTNEYSYFNNNNYDIHRNSINRKIHKNYSAENIMNHDYNYFNKKKKFSNHEIMNMKISFDLLRNKISQLKEILSQENMNLINYKHKDYLPQKEYRNYNRKIYYKSISNINSNSSILKKYSINDINTKLNFNTNFESDFDKYIINNKIKKSNKPFSICPYTNNYILNNYKSINNQKNSNSDYNELLNKYNSQNLENSTEKQDTEELSDLASDLLYAFNIDNHNENYSDNINKLNNISQKSNNNNIINPIQKFKNTNQIDLKSNNNYNISNTIKHSNIELNNNEDNNINNNVQNNKNNINYGSLENIKYYSDRSRQNKNIKVLRKKDKSSSKDSEEDKLFECNILSHNSKINSPISNDKEIKKENSKSIINKIQDIFNEYEKDEEYNNEIIKQKEIENKDDNLTIEKDKNINIENLNSYEEENESEIFAEIVEKAKEISKKADSKNNNHSKNVSFSEDKTILIKYKENEQITKLNIYDNNQKKIKFTPIKLNKYLNNLKKPIEQKSIITNSPRLDIEKIKKESNEKIFQKNKLRRNLSDININNQLKEKYKIIYNKENLNKDNNKKKEMSPIINRNINLIKTIETYNKKGLKYHPKNKKEKEHKLEPIHICDKIIKDPQKFFTVKVFDNLLKSYNIKGIENNENKKNKNEKYIKKIVNKKPNKKYDYKKTFNKIKEYFEEEKSNIYIDDE